MGFFSCRQKKCVWVLLLASVVLLIATPLLWVCWPRDALVEPHVHPTANGLMVDVGGTKVNQILSVIFYSKSDEEYLWIIHPNKPSFAVDYGRQGDCFVQAFPVDMRAPRAVRPNEPIILCVVFQYDDLFTARYGEVFYSLHIRENGELSIVRSAPVYLPNLNEK
jgi:hypothetical protein